MRSSDIIVGPAQSNENYMKMRKIDEVDLVFFLLRPARETCELYGEETLEFLGDLQTLTKALDWLCDSQLK